MSFQEDLKQGQDAEHTFAEYLKRDLNLDTIEFSQWKNIYYDIKATYKDWSVITYEVKMDRKYHKTWNFVVEFECFWKTSWIYASSSDKIVYYVGWKWWMQDRQVLIDRLVTTPKRVSNWWDFKASRMWVIKGTELPNLFELLDFEVELNVEEDG